ncbi:LOW QUALITY PROTEIN: hypothetical protein HJC23_010561 [Cyclotella cryptica]|uniref:GH26 domain-containing protein n=1 Tax=Cyclotella cryptica TaxID=29204 RepID=A0ABD3NW96_9STRA
MNETDKPVTKTNENGKKRPSCRPPVNTTYLTIGQDLFSIHQYVLSQYNYSLHHSLITNTTVSDVDTVTGKSAAPLAVSQYVPSAFMVYTDLASLKGLWEPTDYGSGVEYADGVLNMFPSNHYLEYDGSDNVQEIRPSKYSPAGLQIGLWLNGTQGCFSIYTGVLDHQIQLLISYLEHCRASKVFIRIGYEFDNPSFGFSDDPAMYILAFRKIVSDCRDFLSDEANDRVLFVWHSWGAPMASKKLSLERFYPGDKFVDWIGVSIFQQVFPWGAAAGGGSMAEVENVLKFAVEHDKPIMIAESTPFGGIELNQATKAVQSLVTKENHNFGDSWDRWYGKVLEVINKYDISMWCYIDADWESQPMWHNVGFGETRIATNELVMAKWQEQIIRNGLRDRDFLFSGSLEGCGRPINAPDELDNLENDFEWNRLSHIGSFIVIPFLLVSAVFYIPYFILGGDKSPNHGLAVKKGERKPLLSGIDQVNNSTRTLLKSPTGSP